MLRIFPVVCNEASIEMKVGFDGLKVCALNIKADFQRFVVTQFVPV